MWHRHQIPCSTSSGSKQNPSKLTPHLDWWCTAYPAYQGCQPIQKNAKFTTSHSWAVGETLAIKSVIQGASLLLICYFYYMEWYLWLCRRDCICSPRTAFINLAPELSVIMVHGFLFLPFVVQSNCRQPVVNNRMYSVTPAIQFHVNGDGSGVYLVFYVLGNDPTVPACSHDETANHPKL